MTDLTQRARDVAGRLKRIEARRRPDGYAISPTGGLRTWGGDTEQILANPDGPEAAAIISELVERIVGVWQDIETAPRDGVILIGLPVAGNLREGDRRVYEGRWNNCDKAFTSVNGFILLSAATHWMPLPPPPSVLGKQEGEG